LSQYHDRKEKMKWQLLADSITFEQASKMYITRTSKQEETEQNEIENNDE
jgi:hypothetical protein